EKAPGYVPPGISGGDQHSQPRDWPVEGHDAALSRAGDPPDSTRRYHWLQPANADAAVGVDGRCPPAESAVSRAAGGGSRTLGKVVLCQRLSEVTRRIF